MSARKLTALTKKQPATPMDAMMTPPAEGPRIFEKLKTDDCSPMALSNSSLGTRLLTSDWRAV